MAEIGEGHGAVLASRGGRLGCRFLYASLSIWLVGCSTSVDPHEGGFVSGIVGLGGGGYQRRIDERDRAHQQARDARQSLEEQARLLEQDRLGVMADLAAAQARLAHQERRIAQQRARLAASRGNSDAGAGSARALDQAQARVASVQARLREGRTDDQPVVDLRKKSQSIEAELDEIDAMVGVVSGAGF